MMAPPAVNESTDPRPVVVSYHTGGDTPRPIRWDWATEGNCVVVGPAADLVLDRISAAASEAGIEVLVLDPAADDLERALGGLHARIACMVSPVERRRRAGQFGPLLVVVSAVERLDSSILARLTGFVTLGMTARVHVAVGVSSAWGLALRPLQSASFGHHVVTSGAGRARPWQRPPANGNRVVPLPLAPWRPPAVVEIGAVGEWLVMYGHVDPQVAAALLVAHAGQSWGIERAPELYADGPTLNDLANGIEHLFAVEHDANDIDPLAGRPRRESWIELTTPNSLGSFPVTLFRRY
jgi:hypothetical protein